MLIVKTRKYRKRSRYPVWARQHAHGWAAWKPERVKKMSKKRLLMWKIRHKLVEPFDPDNWEGIERQPDTEQAPEGV